MVKDSNNYFIAEPEARGLQPLPRARRPQVYVNDKQRLQLAIMITDFKLSCYQASKVLKLPYTNAKVICRLYRTEKRVTSLINKDKKSHKDRDEEFVDANYSILRDDAQIKIANVLDTSLLTQPQYAKIYQQNFDDFIGKKLIKDLEN